MSVDSTKEPQSFSAQEQVKLLSENMHNSTTLISQNKLVKAVQESDAEFFFVRQLQDVYYLNHLKIYNNKEDVLHIIKELFNPTHARKKATDVEVYEVKACNVFNENNTDSGHTNLSILTELNINTKINLHFEELGYVLNYKHYDADYITSVGQLADMLCKLEIYPTTGDALEGTLKFVPEVQVYKVLKKL